MNNVWIKSKNGTNKSVYRQAWGEDRRLAISPETVGAKVWGYIKGLSRQGATNRKSKVLLASVEHGLPSASVNYGRNCSPVDTFDKTNQIRSLPPNLNGRLTGNHEAVGQLLQNLDNAHRPQKKANEKRTLVRSPGNDN